MAKNERSILEGLNFFLYFSGDTPYIFLKLRIK